MNQIVQLLFAFGLVQLVQSHGFMVSPAARNCMWRYGWGTPKNYDDNQLWCGGRSIKETFFFPLVNEGVNISLGCAEGIDGSKKSKNFESEFDLVHYKNLFFSGAWKMAALGGKCGVCGDPADQQNQPHA